LKGPVSEKNSSLDAVTVFFSKIGFAAAYSVTLLKARINIIIILRVIAILA
jgi:hypothetical protein